MNGRRARRATLQHTQRAQEGQGVGFGADETFMAETRNIPTTFFDAYDEDVYDAEDDSYYNDRKHVRRQINTLAARLGWVVLIMADVLSSGNVTR